MILDKQINVLGAFCGLRDVETLTKEALFARIGCEQADVMVLFGGSILAGGDVLAEAMKQGVAKKYIIVGGEGHTTESMRQRMHGEYPGIETAGESEAVCFDRYLRVRYGLKADYLETRSTNCGNNISNLLALLKENNVSCRSVILTQDATMQRRMDAGLRKLAPDMMIVNYACYAAKVIMKDGRPDFEEKAHGLWDMERYVSLLLGEIPRLTDDENGYGPKGKGFIAHVDVPDEVKAAFEFVKNARTGSVREANPLYAG